MLNFRTILHPTDFSEPAMYAFGLARALAKDSGAELLVVHVAPVWHRRRRRQRRERYEALRQLTTSDPNVFMYPLLLEGPVATRIVCAASQLECDLIVMGTNGRTGLKRLLLGSVAGAVRRDAPCPVVAVQLPGRDDWELPDFADPEWITGTRGNSPLTTQPQSLLQKACLLTPTPLPQSGGEGLSEQTLTPTRQTKGECGEAGGG